MKRTYEKDTIPVVILCGGKGTRMGSLSREVPKPLLEVGGRPILWHVMQIYASQGFCRFILCLGYKGNLVRAYAKKHLPRDWEVTCVDTGVNTPKSRRLAAVRRLVGGPEFLLAYGDDVADIDLDKLLTFHRKNAAVATITAVRMRSIFGVVDLDRKGRVRGFREKPLLDTWMNAGFMVMNTEIFNYLGAGELEDVVFTRLAAQGKICAYRHSGNWKTMNTLKDNLELNAIWRKGKAFWRRL